MYVQSCMCGSRFKNVARGLRNVKVLRLIGAGGAGQPAG